MGQWDSLLPMSAGITKVHKELLFLQIMYNLFSARETHSHRISIKKTAEILGHNRPSYI